MSDFDSWMQRVDAVVTRTVGCSVHDLADCPFRDWFDDGDSPRQAAGRAIRREQGEDDD